MSNHTEECSGCLAEYNGECSAGRTGGRFRRVSAPISESVKTELAFDILFLFVSAITYII